MFQFGSVVGSKGEAPVMVTPSPTHSDCTHVQVSTEHVPLVARVAGGISEAVSFSFNGLIVSFSEIFT